MQNWKISKLILGNILQAVCWCQPERDNVPSAWKFKSMGKQKQTCWAHAFVRCSTTERNIGHLQICCPDLIESSFAEDVILLSNIYCQLSTAAPKCIFCAELNCPALKEEWNGVDRNSVFSLRWSAYMGIGLGPIFIIPLLWWWQWFFSDPC